MFAPCQFANNLSISESYQDEEPRAAEASEEGDCRPDGFVEAVVRARRRRRLTEESLSSSSGQLQGATGDSRNFIFYVMMYLSN